MKTAALRSTTAMPAAMAALLLAAAPLSAQEDGEGFLGTLTLTAGKRDIATGSAVSTTVVDEEEIADRQASTIAQLVDSVPGVTLVNGTNPTGSGINIRGYGATGSYGADQKVAVVIDGASVGGEEIYRLGTQLFTDPFLYKNIEVLRGTIGSFEYGSGVIGGVVKMETKDASDLTGGVPGFRLGQTFEYSSAGDGLTSSTTLAWQADERLEFLLNYTYRDHGDYKDGTGTTIANTKFRTPSFLFKTKLNFGANMDQSLTFSYNETTSDEKDVPYDAIGAVGATFGNVDRTVDSRSAVLEYRWDPADNDLIDITANLSYADQKIDNSYIPGSSPLEADPLWPTVYGPMIMSTADAKLRYETTKLTVKNTARFDTGVVSHELRTGVEFIRKVRKDAGSSAPGGTDERMALFVIDQMKMGGFTVTPALRFEKSDLTDTAGTVNYKNDGFMGGLALAYDFGNGFSVFGSGAYTVGLPPIDDVGDPTRATVRETSRTYEIGASYASTGVFTPGDNLAIRANYFRTEFLDNTTYIDNATFSPFDYVETEGFELEASYGLENGLYFDLNAYTGSGQGTVAGTTSRWATQPANAYGLTIGKKWDDRLDLSWEVVHNTKKYDASGTKLPDSTIHNLRATFKPQNGVFQDTAIRVGVENVLDEAYTGHLSARPAPGRTFKLTLSKMF